MSAQQQQMEVHFNFFSKIVSLPMVGSALGFATNSYDRVKNSNAIVTNALSRAEQSVNYVLETSKPVVIKFEKQINFADDFACRSLEKVEEYVPILKQSPTEIKKNTMEKYEEMKKAGTDKVVNLKDYGMERINSVVYNQYTQVILKSALDLTESAIDHYLPRIEGETDAEETSAEETNVVERVTSLSDKMKRRLQKQLLSQLEYVQKRSVEIMDQVNALRSSLAQRFLQWNQQNSAESTTGSN